MSLKLQPNVGLQTVLKEGTKLQRGLEEAVFRNISAVLELAAITRSSFGPHGLNKLILTQLSKLFVTADAGTILKELDVQHPAARMVVMASQQQDAEMGDGTNAVVILAAALLENARELLKMGLKASVVAEGFVIAHCKAQELLEGLTVKCARDADSDGGSNPDDLKKIIRTVLMAKQYGVEDQLCRLVLDACTMVNEFRTGDDVERLQMVNPDNIRCVKIMGGCLADSQVISGVVLNRLPESTVKRASDCKVAVYTCPIDIAQTETKGTVLFSNASEMLAFSSGEEELIEGKIRAIAESGVKLLVSSEKIGEMALHFINKYSLIALRVTSKFDLQRICKATGAPALVKFVVPSEASQVGHVATVECVEIGGDKCCVISNPSSLIASIVLRGATQSVMDDYERAIEDAINVVRVLAKRDHRVVAGAGAAEAELSRQLSDFALTTPGIVQYPLRAFAEALEAIPAALATNAGYDRTDAVAKLLAVHAAGNPHHGISLDSTARDPCVDALAGGIVDSLAVKQRALALAWDAANTVLLTDQIIMSKPAGGPKPRPAGPQDD